MRKSIFVSVYSPAHRRRKGDNDFITKLITVTAIISIILISVSVILLRSIPRDDFFRILNLSTGTSNEATAHTILPEPTEEVRLKADRLREILYDDYIAHVYEPLDGEMDNVYVYDYYKKCYLTFDDGPSSVTPQILDVLKRYKVKATFFVTGNRAEANPKTLRAIAKDGHTIGNHTYSHVYSDVYDSALSFKKEVEKCQNAIDDALGYKYDNLVFRFPGGYDSLTSESAKSDYRKILKNAGYKYIDWSCLTGDSNTTEPTEDYLMKTLTQTIGSSKSGDVVVLMHDSPTKKITADTLPQVIEYLYEQGYTFEILTNKKQDISK